MKRIISPLTFLLTISISMGNTILIDSLIQSNTTPKPSISEVKTISKRSNEIERITIPGYFHFKNKSLFKPEIYRYDSGLGSILFIASTPLNDNDIKCLHLVLRKILNTSSGQVSVIKEFKINNSNLPKTDECKCLPETNLLILFINHIQA